MPRFAYNRLTGVSKLEPVRCLRYIALMKPVLHVFLSAFFVVFSHFPALAE